MPKPTKGLAAQYAKFNLHAGVSVPRGLPAARERLLRYCARPPLALERLSVRDDGKIEDVVRARSELRRRDLPEQPPPLSRARSPDLID